MIELKTETFITSVDVPPGVAAVFPHPIIFYMAHRNDRRLFFTTFVILDFKKKELRYIVSYLPDNIAAVDRYDKDGVFEVSLKVHNPHSSIQIAQGSFLTFVERATFFYSVDYANNKLFAYTIDDLRKMTGEKIREFCCTVYKDDKDTSSFYLSAVADGPTAEQDELLLYRCAVDTLQLTLLQRIPGQHGQAPHVTRKFGDYLLNSEFDNVRITCNGALYSSTVEFIDFVYKDLYKEFCALRGFDFSEERFYQNNTVRVLKVLLEDDFREFCNVYGPNLLAICGAIPKYSFTIAPGHISVFNIKAGTFNRYETTLCTPAHFEIDEEENVVYVSSHNFAYLDRHYYFGPAAIDKFVFKNGVLEKQGTFMRPDGYRYTTHKFFRYNGKSYMCVFGQPNRLFFINTDTMEMEYYDNIGPDFLSEQSDVLAYVNSDNLEPITVKTMMVSSDGRYIFILSYLCMYIYSFPERKIVARMAYWGDVQLKDGINLTDFYKRTTHVDYLA